MATHKQDQPDRRSSTSQDKAPRKAPRDEGYKSDRGDGIKPKDADPNYGPPDPDDPQRSGT